MKWIGLHLEEGLNEMYLRSVSLRIEENKQNDAGAARHN